MESTANTTDLKEYIISRFESSVNGSNPALSEKRKFALERLKSLAFPTTKNEEWKYTNPAPILKKEYNLETKSTLTKEDIQNVLFKGLKGDTVVFVNGAFRPDLSEIKSTGIEIKTFSETDPSILEKHLSTSVMQKDVFTEINTAFTPDGLLIRFPKGKVFEEPVLVYSITDTRTSNTLSQPRLLIIGEENSQGIVVESFATTGDNYSFTNTVTEIILKDNANVSYYKIENDAENSYHIGNTNVFQEGKSVFSGSTITLNGSIVRNNLHVSLQAPHSEASFYGLYFMKDKQHVDNHTLVDHAVPNCLSDELYKGILKDKATGVFNGKIFVKQDAQKTNAFQSNKTVLLSPDATMNTKPQLEIFADDVKCSHGATVGQMEVESLFYLRSRGMSEDSARALLMLAFAQDVIDHIKLEPLKDYLTQAIEQRLQNL